RRALPAFPTRRSSDLAEPDAVRRMEGDLLDGPRVETVVQGAQGRGRSDLAEARPGGAVRRLEDHRLCSVGCWVRRRSRRSAAARDRKSTRLTPVTIRS